MLIVVVPSAVASPVTVPLPEMFPAVDFAFPLTTAGLFTVTVPLAHTSPLISELFPVSVAVPVGT